MPVTIPIARSSPSFFASADSVRTDSTLACLSLSQTGSGEHEAADHVRMIECKVDRDHRSERYSTLNGAFDLQEFEERARS